MVLAARSRSERRAGRVTRRASGLLVCLGVLGVVCLLSIALGTRNISLGTVWDAFAHFTDTDDQAIVRDLRVPRTVLKLAPGIDHALLPPGAEGEWVSVDGDLVEAAFWCGPLAAAPRRATLLRSNSSPMELTGSGTVTAPVGPVGRFLFDPDPAVVRAHLVAEFAALVGGRIGDPAIAYVYTDEPVASPFGRRLEITDVLPFSLKRLRTLLRDRGVGRLEIRKRGSALEPEQFRRDLRLSGPNAGSLVLTRVAGAPTVLLCVPDPGPARG